MSSRPMLTQREAAAACSVSRTTIRRREAGDLPGAVQDPVRGWVIPVDDLLAAGLRLHAPSPPDEVASPGVQERPVGPVAQVQGEAALRPSWSVCGTSTPWPWPRPNTAVSWPGPRRTSAGAVGGAGRASRTFSGR
ncbi:helix-turn-helix domain-containing protein [Streptomyces sp. SL203]|nr:helix-turn-helix domain-containing protein [Streptomyces sp. SL203]MCY1649388.1 helix-turn-helix domain-containing protein [Streptomyces sp. SL203]